MRQEGELGLRFPTEDEVSWTRHTVSVQKIQINQPLPEGTFRFMPPPNAIPETGGRCGVSMGGGTGFVEHNSNDRRRLEHHGSHEWQGDTLVVCGEQINHYPARRGLA
jgi:hypothetical protein